MKLTFLIFIIIPIQAFLQDCDSVPSMNQEVVQHALGKKGKKVDRGECWDLIRFALNSANAKWDGLEGYGKEINWKNECVYPGDIIRFDKVKITYKIGNTTYTETMQHHVAVIYEIKNKNEWLILDQNTEQNGRKVGISIVRISAVKSGKVRVYRPVNNS